MCDTILGLENYEEIPSVRIIWWSVRREHVRSQPETETAKHKQNLRTPAPLSSDRMPSSARNAYLCQRDLFCLGLVAFVVCCAVGASVCCLIFCPHSSNGNDSQQISVFPWCGAPDDWCDLSSCCLHPWRDMRICFGRPLVFFLDFLLWRHQWQSENPLGPLPFLLSAPVNLHLVYRLGCPGAHSYFSSLFYAIVW